MMNFFRKHKRNIFIATVAIFVGGTFVGFGGYFFSDRGAGNVAEVNGRKISRRRFDFLYNRQLDAMRRQGQELNSEALKRVETEVIQELIQDEVFSQEAEKFGIIVTDGELAADIRRFPAFQRDGHFDQRLYYDFLRRALNTTPKEFEEFRRRQIAFFKLRYFITTSVFVPDAEILADFTKKFPGKSKTPEKDLSDFSGTYRQEAVNAVFNEYLRQLNNTVKIKVFWKG